ncbi:MAG TPA: class I SAM-dependent methyltransferase [Plantibacter sp.]|uniref:class I SAM-dependent methyltransferase n=1 Tax=unclassified Plantibacter TaxID=2624265 RepID=UPI002D01E5DC|nr:class I SAM-dependent methyltransferase [Plantibacter sp.]
MIEHDAAAAARSAYAHRAAEYAELLGTMDSVHPSDVQLVSAWADHVDGPIIDAGCGPGHWTEYLASRGHQVRGVDLVPEFIAHARKNHPGLAFDAGNLDSLDAEADSVGGVLAWYSLIHHHPTTIATTLAEFARVLAPGGDILLGFFVGSVVDPFDHAVVTAYRWPVEELEAAVEHAGFTVIETHTRTTRNQRPHGAIVARLTPARSALPTSALGRQA